MTPAQADLIPVLDRLGIPVVRLIAPPSPNGSGGYWSLCEVARGENLLLWALGGTPHRLRLATDRAFEGIDRLQSITEAIKADPLGARLPVRTLADEAAALTDDVKWKEDPWLNFADSEMRAWRADAWFTSALAKTQSAIADIDTPLVYTNYIHFFPLSYRIAPGNDDFNELEGLGWPGDARLKENPLVEFVNPFGHFGDPLLGLAMVWIYDCYPFVHTGFVEQYLWQRSLSRRDFGPRLVLRALQTIARQLPYQRPAEASFWDALHGYVEQGLAWM